MDASRFDNIILRFYPRDQSKLQTKNKGITDLDSLRDQWTLLKTKSLNKLYDVYYYAFLNKCLDPFLETKACRSQGIDSFSTYIFLYIAVELVFNFIL